MKAPLLIAPSIFLLALILLIRAGTEQKTQDKVIVVAKAHILRPDNTLTHDIDGQEKYLLYGERINATYGKRFLLGNQITIITDSANYTKFQKGDTLPQLYY